MSVIKPENEEQAKFNWEFYLEDEITMVFQIKFDQPEEISSNGVDRDQFRIYFFDTKSFMYCNPDKVISLGAAQSRKLQQDFLSVPENTIIRVELPPQREFIEDETGEEE